MKNQKFYKEMITIGLPVTLQSIFQASYSLIDELMVGTLGDVAIAGGGLGAKFSSLVTFTLTSVATVAGIMIAQYHGNQDEKGVRKSFYACSFIMTLLGLIFAFAGVFLAEPIIGIYTKDMATKQAGADYLRIIAISFVPMFITLMLSAYFRSVEKSKYPMYASVFSILCNILFNYLLIFGKCGFPALGLEGAALGTLVARTLEAGLLLACLFAKQKSKEISIAPIFFLNKDFFCTILVMVIPIIINEFSWSIGENLYAVVYGRMGTDSLAAMTLTNPLQGMFIGMFSGLSSAAVVMVGKRLGNSEYEEAYHISKLLVKTGIIGSVIISAVLVLFIPFYVRWFSVSAQVARLTRYIVYALALVLFAKITNMILAGGVLRSGGNTNYTLGIDLTGTWLFGVPLAFISAFCWHLPIYHVYFILSMEEVVRLLLAVIIFRRKKWMHNITAKE